VRREVTWSTCSTSCTPYQIVRAVKGIPFDGHATITVGGVQQRLDSSNPQPAVAWAIERLGERIFAEYEGEIVLVVAADPAARGDQRERITSARASCRAFRHGEDVPGDPGPRAGL
jgi:hypothetical protein